MLAECKFISVVDEAFEKVTFVIPAHNEAAYIRPTIEAIRFASVQCGIVSEILVVNDDSTDETAELAEQAGARVVHVKLRNIGAVRNAGAKAANYPWLFFVDADTILPAETLLGALVALRDGYAGGGARVVMKESKPIFWVKQFLFHCVAMIWQVFGYWAAGCFMFCQKSVFDSFGGFNEEFFAAEELFFSRNVKRRGRFHLVRHPVQTSDRKLHSYSTWQLIRFLMSPLARFWAPLQSRTGLEILYEDNR